MALTPEKIALMNKPYVNPDRVKRTEREKKEWEGAIAEQQRVDRQLKEACLHTDANGKTSLCLVHNFPDHNPRGVCPQCNDWIHPMEWRIASSDEEAARLAKLYGTRVQPGHAYLVPEHKNYGMVRFLQSRS
jgi:hypothetical protein